MKICFIYWKSQRVKNHIQKFFRYRIYDEKTRGNDFKSYPNNDSIHNSRFFMFQNSTNVDEFQTKNSEKSVSFTFFQTKDCKTPKICLMYWK